MNWEAIGAVGEIFSALAVLVTLVYLATQIKQANDQSRYAASADLFKQFNELNRMVASDAALRQVLTKCGELSDDERELIYNFAMMFCNGWVSVQIAYDSRQIERELWAAGAKDVAVEIERWPNFCAGVEQWLSNYPEHAHREIFDPVKKRRDGADGTAA